MADQTSTFAVALEDGTSEVAKDAASALEHLKSALQDDMAALKGMNQAMRNLKSAGLEGTAQFKALKDEITAQKAAIGAAQQSMIKHGGSVKDIVRGELAAAKAAQRLKEDLSAAKEAEDAAAKAAKEMAAQAKEMAAQKAAAVKASLAYAAAFAAVAVAAVRAAAAVLSYAISSSDARRNERLALEGLTKTRNWYGLAAGSASDLQAAIDRVGDSSSLGRDKLVEMASGLYRANLRGAALEQALEGVATASDVAGDAQGEMYRAMFVSAGAYGKNTKQVLDEVRARFGAIAKMKALSLDAQSRKMRENFARIFSGLNLDSFLGVLKQANDMFSQTTSSGRALKTIVESLFQPLIDFVGGQGVLVKRFFQGATIAALLMTIGVLKIRNALRSAFGDSEILQSLDMQTAALYLGAAAFGALAGVVAGLAAAFVILVAPIALAAVRLYGFYRIVMGAWDTLSNLDFGEIGRNLINGFVNGIKSGVNAAVSAVEAMGDRAMTALKKKLQIFSPSRAFAKLGMQIPRGVAVGVTAGTGEATGAIRQMAAKTEGAYGTEPGAGGDATAGGRAPSNSVNVNLVVNVTAKGDDAQSVGESVGEIVRRELKQLMAGVAIGMGARSPAQ
ncbi:MAG: Minor tail protein [Polyangiaceae bacterium]|jgi:hypothetical protein|nr:Minor tail protein [Polyangiaceae bacterium]